MHNIQRMQVSEWAEELFHDVGYDVLWNFLFGFWDDIHELPSSAKLCDDIIKIVIIKYLMQLNNVGMI